MQKGGSQRRTAFPKVRIGPSGVHLFDRLTGMNCLIDEISVPSQAWSRAPRHVSIALTNVCDLHCKYCYAPKKRAELKYESILEWMDELDTHGALGVGFGGGEPTLYRRFSDLCTYAFHHTRLAVSFTTHAHHLNSELLAAISGSVHFIRVSMDGFGHTYERLRGRKFSALEGRIAGLREISPFGINYVVNADTILDLDVAVEFARASGASEFLLLPEQPTATQAGISAGTASALHNWVSRYSGDMRLAVSDNGSDGLPTCNPLFREEGILGFAHVSADGSVKRTSYDERNVKIDSEGIMAALDKLQHLAN